MNFNNFNLNDLTLKAIEKYGFKEPTKIQQLVLPHALDNTSLACKGKTGSGKTHCFLIPIADKIIETSKTLQTIILVPTRELAMQTYQVCRQFFVDYDIKISCLTGGFDTLKEKEKMSITPQILVGTPEKIKEIGIESGLLNLSTVTTFVIDEADMTLEMGFLNEVDKIASLINKNAQFMVFSATIPVGVKQFIKNYFPNKPLMIEDKSETTNPQIEHILYPVRGRDVKELLMKIISHINPYICLIFLNTKEEVNSYYHYLIDNGIDCEMIHGDLQSRERKRNIKRSIEGKFRFIVCSDIASRGIDIEGVSHVISIGFPKNNLEFYTHRAGRCGRSSLTGTAITLFSPSDKVSIDKLESEGIKFAVKEIKNDEWKDLAEINARRKRKNTRQNPLDDEIKKTIRIHATKKVKPNYKKKVKLAVDKVKRKHKRQIIQKDIKKRITTRAIIKTKGEKKDD